MQEETLWLRFAETGKISDYLSYCNYKESRHD